MSPCASRTKHGLPLASCCLPFISSSANFDITRDMLCARCQDIFEGDLERAEGERYATRRNHDSWTLERIANHEGCVICHGLWQNFVAQHNFSSSEYTEILIKREVWWRQEDGDLSYPIVDLSISPASKIVGKNRTAGIIIYPKESNRLDG
jgi:hypothetical protein